MANIYWADKKAPKPETKEALMRELVNCTDDTFHVRFDSDGAGHMVCVYVEAEHERRDPYEWKKLVPPKFMGWRVVKIFVPPDYIKAILTAVRD
tara:strand:- start:46 stop:327 length:282 start_codon:yes stop_codon:yes gene_type:complete